MQYLTSQKLWNGTKQKKMIKGKEMKYDKRWWMQYAWRKVVVHKSCLVDTTFYAGKYFWNRCSLVLEWNTEYVVDWMMRMSRKETMNSYKPNNVNRKGQWLEWEKMNRSLFQRCNIYLLDLICISAVFVLLHGYAYDNFLVQGTLLFCLFLKL